MERLPREHLEALRAHWDRSAMPEDGSPAREAFDAVGTRMCEQYGAGWPPDSTTKLSPRQLQCCALFSIVSAVVWDWFTVGVLINQPAVLQPAIAAARELNLPATIAALEEADKALPQNIRGDDDMDARIEWMNSISGSPLESRLAALAEEFDGGPASNEIFDTCVRLAVENPEEFFEPA